MTQPQPIDAANYAGPAPERQPADGPIASKAELFQILDELQSRGNSGSWHHVRQRLRQTDTSLWSDPEFAGDF